MEWPVAPKLRLDDVITMNDYKLHFGLPISEVQNQQIANSQCYCDGLCYFKKLLSLIENNNKSIVQRHGSDDNYFVEPV